MPNEQVTTSRVSLESGPSASSENPRRSGHFSIFHHLMNSYLNGEEGTPEKIPSGTDVKLPSLVCNDLAILLGPAIRAKSIRLAHSHAALPPSALLPDYNSDRRRKGST